jgi:trans-aconitate 2-methyltransferase
MTDWNPEVYALYREYRERPALDLLTRLPANLTALSIWDLGCGPGAQAALLAERFPQARVTGLDSSPQMLEQARKRDARVDWRLGDIAGFAPDVPADLIYTNAALQWLGDHATLFPHLASTLAPGGVLACQMPVVQGVAWRESLDEIVAAGAWSARLSAVEGVQPTHDPGDYQLQRRHLDHHLPARAARRRPDCGLDDGHDPAPLRAGAGRSGGAGGFS